MTTDQIYDKYYPQGRRVREILLQHSKSVADFALKINQDKRLQLNHEEIITAAMLHDIGIFLTDAKGIDCYGCEPYIRHGILGADLLRLNGFDEKYARVAERHTGAGIYSSDIEGLNLQLPSDRILYPETVLEKLICYADKFFSKSGDMKMKSLERVRESMARHSSQTLERFELLHSEFGLF